MHTIHRACIGTAGLAIAAMMFGMQGTGTLATTYETPPTGYDATKPIYTFPLTGSVPSSV